MAEEVRSHRLESVHPVVGIVEAAVLGEQQQLPVEDGEERPAHFQRTRSEGTPSSHTHSSLGHVSIRHIVIKYSHTIFVLL